MVIPQALLDHILAEGAEQERMEAWIVEQVNGGAALPGLYPMNAETKARYAAIKEIRPGRKRGRKERGNAMDIHLAGSRPTRRAPREYFTGTVWQDPIIAARGSGAVFCNPRLLRTGRADQLAFAPSGPDAIRHLGSRSGADQGRPGARDPAGRCGLDPAG